MSWTVKYLEEAQEDLKRLDKTARIQVINGIRKVLHNPLPASEGGYGKSLGNKREMKLAGFCKIKFSSLGIRVVYKLIREENNMLIVVVSVRADEEVYKEAAKRKNKYNL